MAKTKEVNFEDAIEADLIGTSDWTKGDPDDFDRQTALVAKDFFAFVQDTQSELWEELRRHHQTGLEAVVLDALTKAMDSRGSLDVLRHGFKFYGKKLDCAYFKPAHGMNPDIMAKYAKNRLVVTRQVRFAPDEDKSIDLVLFLNGFPVATAELKNPLTQQNVHRAIAQYRDRDQRHALLQFKKRALVHFAVDPDMVYMTTRLQGKDTTFLPFNRGHQGGAGNPEHPSGHRAGYLWQEVWQRDSWLDIIGSFVHLATEERIVDGRKVTTESIIFPRYHQLDVVRKLDRTARAEGAGHSYLVQHSAGSGKSNSIAWLTHRLASLHDDHDRKVFDSVIVVTDRRVLDRQLQDTIYQFEHKQGVVTCISDKEGSKSPQLAAALEGGTQIIIVTLQTFPAVAEKLGKLPNRHYALVVDEAHSSQTGEASRHLKEVLAAKDLDGAEQEDVEDEDAEDRLLKVMQSRGKQKNLSFFAFTATPKAKTLEIFGHRDAEGKPIPFHLYSMRQAIEEGFILDVLQSYTTYKTYYKLVKAIEDDPKVNKRQAASQLARYVSFHPHNLAQKTEVMVEHFRQKVRHRIGGRAKAMVVTRSRLHAVRYKQTFEAYIKEREVPEKFTSDEFQVLLVANKYQTGFDQPLLHTMYVDKRLSGVQAVQTLSRLNRTAAGKVDTFVIDFVNDADEIVRSFQPYYEQTTVADSADPHQLYDLQSRLDAMQVFWKTEVEAFCAIFYKPVARQTTTDHAEMYRQLNPAVDRFRAKNEAEQDEFRNTLTGYVKLYSFLSQVMPFTDPDLEKLYTFGRHLELKLPRDEKKTPLALDGEVALKYYRLEMVSESNLVMADAQAVPLKAPSDVGTRKPKDDEATLSEIIEVLNERFGTEFTEADQLLFDQFIAAAKQDKRVVEQALANQLDNFALAMKSRVEELMIDRMDQNQDIVTRYLNDPEFQVVAFKALVSRLFSEIRQGAAGKAP